MRNTKEKTTSHTVKCKLASKKARNAASVAQFRLALMTHMSESGEVGWAWRMPAKLGWVHVKDCKSYLCANDGKLSEVRDGKICTMAVVCIVHM